MRQSEDTSDLQTTDDDQARKRRWVFFYDVKCFKLNSYNNIVGSAVLIKIISYAAIFFLKMLTLQVLIEFNGQNGNKGTHLLNDTEKIIDKLGTTCLA